MKKLHLCLLFTLAVLTASSQKVYFIYIQTESEQPFFVKMNERLRSSTASGYIILSKLVDSTYNFSVGFPENKWPEQNFSVTLNKKDHGYLLKNFGEKGWGLFNLQTLAVQMAVTGKASIEVKPGTENTNVSVFTEILAKAADDPSLKEKPVQAKVEPPVAAEEKRSEPVAAREIIKEEPKVETNNPVNAKPVEVVETAVVKTEEAKESAITKPVETIEQPIVKKEPPVVIEEPKVELKEQPANNNTEETKTVVSESYKASQVKKWSESSTTEGFGLVFIDNYDNGIKDTIRLVIPNPKPAVSTIKEEPREEKKFLDINTETPAKENPPVVVEEKNNGVTGKATGKNNCSDVATESDFFKLRKKMAAAENDEDMIGEAKKYFKTKCFSTGQLKNLGALFLADEGKYKFYMAAYQYVSDPGAFNSLQSELKDEYYTSRFQAMLRN